MRIIYRISESGYNKVKPDYINNKNCLENAIKCFPSAAWLIIGDNLSDDTRKMVEDAAPGADFSSVKVGHGAGTFNLALDEALKLNDDEIVYFLENDYLHRENSDKIIEDVLSVNDSLIGTLYSHKDKWIPAKKGGNPYVDDDGAEVTKVYLGKKHAYMLTNSTTMTFFCKVKTLREIEPILRKHTNGRHPNDFQMFIELREMGYALVQPVPPSYATHGETNWLAPLLTDESDVDAWGKIV